MLFLRRSNCIVTAFGIVTLHTQPLSAPDESGVRAQPVHRIAARRVTMPDDVTIQFDLLKMSIVLLKTCQGL